MGMGSHYPWGYLDGIPLSTFRSVIILNDEQALAAI